MSCKKFEPKSLLQKLAKKVLQSVMWRIYFSIVLSMFSYQCIPAGIEQIVKYLKIQENTPDTQDKCIYKDNYFSWRKSKSTYELWLMFQQSNRVGMFSVTLAFLFIWRYRMTDTSLCYSSLCPVLPTAVYICFGEWCNGELHWVVGKTRSLSFHQRTHVVVSYYQTWHSMFPLDTETQQRQTRTEKEVKQKEN